MVKSKGFQSRVSFIGGSFDAGFTSERGALATNPGGFIVIAMMINDRRKLNRKQYFLFENLRSIQDVSKIPVETAKTKQVFVK